MRTYTQHAGRRPPTGQTPQSQPAPGTAPNSAGGYAFPVDDWTRLDRFLVLGSEGGTYYIDERTLTRENAAAVDRCIQMDGLRVVQRITEVSEAGRAPKNDPAIFALAMCLKTGDAATRHAAGNALPLVCRTGTHLFHMAAAVQSLGGWGRNTRKAFSRWYTSQTADDLAYQMVKYRARDGWAHRDLLRLCHPRGPSAPAPWAALMRWAITGDSQAGMGARTVTSNRGKRKYPAVEPDVLPSVVFAYELAQHGDPALLPGLIEKYHLPREALPTEALNRLDVWDALLRAGAGMPLTALVRNLGVMTERGLLQPLSAASRYVCDRLADVAGLRKARIHPLALLLAQTTYAAGQGVRGKLAWDPVPAIVDALDAAFYAAFQNVIPNGKRHVLALDVSGSMDGSHVAGTHLSAREAACALALVTARVEPQATVMAFAKGFTPFLVTPRDRLFDVVHRARALPMDATDCAVPMLWAGTHRIAADAFVVYTDSETWAGHIHPFQALNGYRAMLGLPAKLAVMGLTSNGFSIADPNDAGMLDVVGLDAAAPAVVADFIRGAA